MDVEATRTAYHARMHRVLAYIDEHLADVLSVEMLSGVAAFSKHHFQRQFSALFGISLGRYIQLLRLRRASYRLAFRDEEGVLQIALDSGFEGPEAFSRAFRRHFDQSPSDFRREPRWEPWLAAQKPLTQARSKMMTKTFQKSDVRFVNFPETPVAIMTHCGDPGQLGDTIKRFVAWRRATGLTPKVSATFNVFHTEDEPADAFRMDLCTAIRGKFDAAEAGVQASVIPGGRCAVVRQLGGGDDLRAAATFLYAEWLPGSGEELRDFPIFAQRISFFPDVPEHETVTDVFLPIC